MSYLIADNEIGLEWVGAVRLHVILIVQFVESGLCDVDTADRQM